MVKNNQKSFLNYIEVLKPRETSLIILIGVCSAVIAGGGYPPINLLTISLFAIGMGAAGANGLTNYLDRKVDAKMRRTCDRVLPSKLIKSPRRVLPLISCLLIIALSLAWLLNPLCFLFGVIGTIASVAWRKTISCTFFGIIASCAPVLIGWFAISPTFDIQILLLCFLITFWIPLHVWTVMIANREDYLNVGLNFFPLSWQTKNVVRVLFVLSFLLYLVSLLIYLSGSFKLLYLVIANVLGILMIYANARLLFSTRSKAAWRVYKLSAFPYLGVIFVTMCLDIWLGGCLPL